MEDGARHTAASATRRSLSGAAAACEWRYLAEGAAHMVLAYTGPDPSLACKVLRLRKARRGSGRGGSSSGGSGDGGNGGGEGASPPAPVNPTYDEAHLRVAVGAGAGAGAGLTDAQLWSGHAGMQPHFASTTTADELSRAFVATVLTPLLGQSLADAGDLVHVDAQFLAAVSAAAYPTRPPARTAGADVDQSASFALLLHDHNSPPDPHRGGAGGGAGAAGGGGGGTPTNLRAPVFSVEIKPKCGFIPAASVCARGVSRFQMHQALKAGAYTRPHFRLTSTFWAIRWVFHGCSDENG